MKKLITLLLLLPIIASADPEPWMNAGTSETGPFILAGCPLNVGHLFPKFLITPSFHTHDVLTLIQLGAAHV